MPNVFKRNYAEGTIGGNATTANTELNDSGDILNISSSGTRTYDDTWKHSGTTSFKCYGAADTQAVMGWNTGLQKGGAFRGYFKVDAYPSSTVGIANFRQPSSNCSEVQITSTGRVRITSLTGEIYLSAINTFLLGTTVRIEAVAWAGTTSSNGILEVDLYDGDGTAPFVSFATASTNMGTTQISDFRWGKITTTGSPIYTVWVDDVAYEDGRTTFLGPMQGDPAIIYAQKNILEVDTAGSTGTRGIEQFSGAEVTIIEPSTGFFKVEVPNHSHLIKLDLESVADTTVTERLIIPGTQKSNILVCQGGDSSDLSNWG